MEKTFAMIKPNGVANALIGQIISRYEAAGLAVLGIRIHEITGEEVEGFYAEHVGKGFFGELKDFMTSGPTVLVALGGPNAISVVRSINGATNPDEAAPGTIRSDYAPNVGMNVVHSSDGEESAQREVSFWFKEEELVNYQVSKKIAV